MGIDVSKNTLDISLVVEGKTIFYQQINNTVKNIKTVINQCLDQNEANFNDTVFCMEHTGIYNLPLAKWLQEQQAKIWMESGVQIRKSLGMIRGKTDKIDSERIAQYAYTHKHKLNIWQAPRAVIKNISTLLAQRSRLIKCKKQLSIPINEQQDFIDKPIAKQLAYSTAKVVASLDKQLQVTETQIMEIVKSDDNINRLYKIITSVDGIGFVTAMYIITTTNEFIYIDNAKKYACYSGVVPFEHSSLALVLALSIEYHQWLIKE